MYLQERKVSFEDVNEGDKIAMHCLLSGIISEFVGDNRHAHIELTMSSPMHSLIMNYSLANGRGQTIEESLQTTFPNLQIIVTYEPSFSVAFPATPKPLKPPQDAPNNRELAKLFLKKGLIHAEYWLPGHFPLTFRHRPTHTTVMVAEDSAAHEYIRKVNGARPSTLPSPFTLLSPCDVRRPRRSVKSPSFP